jgi:hypothetical protein
MRVHDVGIVEWATVVFATEGTEEEHREVGEWREKAGRKKSKGIRRGSGRAVFAFGEELKSEKFKSLKFKNGSGKRRAGRDDGAEACRGLQALENATFDRADSSGAEARRSLARDVGAEAPTP